MSTIDTITFHFIGELEDSGAIVDVQCQIDEDGDCRDLDSVHYQLFNVLDVISHSQWSDLEWQASKAYKAENLEQLTIDSDNNITLEAVYGLSKPSFNIR
jgi:hypothetical protein